MFPEEKTDTSAGNTTCLRHVVSVDVDVRWSTPLRDRLRLSLLFCDMICGAITNRVAYAGTASRDGARGDAEGCFE